MNLSTRLRNLFGRKDSQSRTLIAQVQTGQYVPITKDYKNFSEEGYQKNVVAFRSVASVARSAAGIRWVLYRKGTGKGSKKRQEIDAHPLLDLIARPNAMMAQSQFIEAVLSFKLISGNAYIEAVGTKKGMMSDITELWPQRPDRMKIVAGPRGFPSEFVYTLGGRETRFRVDAVSLKSPILHLKFFHPTDDWYGLAPVEAAAMGIDTHNAANKWNVSLLQNSARPSGALVATVNERSTGHLSDEQFSRLKRQLEEQYTGANNAGRPMILEGGLDWKQLSFSPQQMEWIENKNTSARDIALAFGVPPMLLGIPGDNTYSNYKEARAALYEETVIPEHDSLCDEFNNWLTPAFGEGLTLASDKDAIMALAPRRQEIWDKVSKANFLTMNEKREAVGYDQVDGGDVILVGSTEVPLESALEDPQPPVAPNPQPNPDPNQMPDDQIDPMDEMDDMESEDPGKSSANETEVKIFNLPNAKLKAKEIRAQLRMRKAAERRMMRQVHAVFDIEGHRVAEACKDLDPQHAQAAALREIDANIAQWKTVLKANLASTAKMFGSRVFDSLKGLSGPEETKAAESRFDSFIKDWIEHHVGERIRDINTVTKEKVLKAIRDAQEENYSEGDTVVDLASKVSAAYEGFGASRSMTIARTETGTTANQALVRAAKSTNIPGLKKEWGWTDDERTREDHKLKNAVVPIDHDFDVGGFAMSQPGDPKGPPEEVCNCRCGVTFIRDQATEPTDE